MKKILIIGESNACRSQMAEGWMKYYTKKYAEVVSAGINPEPVNLFAANSMSNAIINISAQVSKPLSEVLDAEYDFVIFTFDANGTVLPIFKGSPKVFIHPFEMPMEGANSKETDANFDRIRDEIENFCFDFAHQHIRKLY